MKKQTPSPAPSDPPGTETLRTPLPVDLEPSENTLVPLDSEPGNPEPEDATQALPVFEPGRTAEIAPALLPDAQRATALPPRPPRVRRPGAPRKPWVALALGLLVAGGGAAYWYLKPEPDDVLLPLPPPSTSEPAPPELRAYLDQAKGGDARAMHMIALMYWNGLNVRQDRVKGLEWYRKSAAAGDKAAQAELDVIEGK